MDNTTTMVMVVAVATSSSCENLKSYNIYVECDQMSH
jgi:hypothetical protein